MKVSVVIQLLQQNGWRVARTRGSHRQFKHPTKRGLLTVAGEGQCCDSEGYTQFDSQAGWTEERGLRVRYTVILEQGEVSWGAHIPDLPGCVAVGATRDEALHFIKEAIELHIDGLREEGLPVPEPRSEGEVIEIGAA